MSTTTVSGGGQLHSKLTPAEHHAAVQVLAKLTAAGSATHKLSSLLADTLRSATLSGGSVHAPRAAESFAGGVHGAAAKPIVSTLSDTVVAGSGFAGKIESHHQASAVVPASHALAHADTINVAGVTASAVKTEPSHAPKVVGQTIHLSDKTTITVTGVSAHELTKAH